MLFSWEKFWFYLLIKVEIMDWAIVEIEEVLVVMLDEGEWEIYF